MASPDRSHALDHVVVVLFENRSLDNVLGRLYGPDDAKTFEGVLGKELSNPIPSWAEHGADRLVVPYTIATDMDSPNPDSGEEYFHTNTQLFNVLDHHNRFKIGDEVTAPWNAPARGAVPTMDGFVTDYISTFTGEMGRQPTYDEYAHIMTGYTPEQLPVLNGIAREFGVFDHWFSEVPSQTFMNRSFWTAATSSGAVVNTPITKWFSKNDTETIFERLEAHGRELEGLRHGADAPVAHGPHPLPKASRPPRDALRAVRGVRARHRGRHAAGLLAHRAEHDGGPRRLPPRHGPLLRRHDGREARRPVVDPLGRRLLGARVRRLPRGDVRVGHQRLEHGAAHRVGRARRHLRPRGAGAGRAARAAGPARGARLPLRSLGLSGARHHRVALGPCGLGLQRGVPAHVPHRDAAQDLGARACLHAARRGGAHVRPRLPLDQPRDPASWSPIEALPVPAWNKDEEIVSKGLSQLGRGIGAGIIARAKEMALNLPDSSSTTRART